MYIAKMGVKEISDKQRIVVEGQKQSFNSLLKP